MPSSAAIVKKAVSERRRRGEAGSAGLRVLASGPGWRIADIVCTSDAGDRPFEEVHSHASIAIVTAGAFSYHGELGRTQLAAGSILLGNPGACFCCGHEHGAGDRCIAFQLAPEVLEAMWSLWGAGPSARFPVASIPAVKSNTDLVATAEAFASGAFDMDPAELMTRAFRHVVRSSAAPVAPPAASARRVLQIARAVEEDPAAEWTLPGLAKLAGMNPFHFLRCFKQVCGITPYAFLRQARLRESARLLRESDFTIARVAVESGFSDLSTFNHAFKRAFGRSPAQFRAR
jgi:AraC-like DNA-binding protein